jgi:glycosyltransferase involved in cell wall biosynthesis
VVGDAAVLVDPNDTDGLAEAMHRVLTGTELQEALVSKGFERAKRFSWEETARQMLNVYEETYAATWPK